MMWYYWFTLGALIFCLIFYGYYLIKIIRTSKATDFAKPSGKVSSGVAYSMTSALNPRKKASAYLHLPTYTAGLLYHTGTFLSILLFFLFIFLQMPGEKLSIITAIYLLITSFAGFGILIKRIINKNMKLLSNADDYISNLLVSIFQVLTALVLLNLSVIPVYFVFSSIMLIYLPFGKLKHSIFFFAARYHLGVFFGSRNVWPPVKN